jgi:transcriptional regulator with XRE-family HTH domain
MNGSCTVSWSENGIWNEIIFEDIKVFSNKLKKLRKSKGLSLSKFSKEIRWNTEVVKDWESGESVPSVYGLEKISKYFSVSKEYLLNSSNKDFEQLSLF